MATGKLSIRQKMINMMYLVLLAILALNVSAEVLKAFYMMEVSMQKTGENIDAKNNLILNSFAKLMVTQPDRTKEWNDKAKEGQKITDEFVKYLEGLKKELADKSGGRVKDDAGKEAELKNSDNTEKHANYLLNQGKAKELKDKINQTRDKLVALIPKEDRGNIKTDMFTPDEGQKTWESLTFEGVPIAAVMATITKLQNDCKNTYADVLNVLYSKTNSPNIIVDKLDANIIPKKPFVMAGEKFEADIFLAATDSKQAFEIVLDGKSYTSETGKFTYSQIANGQGEHKLNGVIKVKERDGTKEYPFSTTYNVFSGFAAVSADAMNIMYMGVDNPVSVSVPGVPTDRVTATITNGTLTRTRDNKYVARVNTRGEATVNVSVRTDEGTIKSFGSYKFVVKRIPPPTIKLGNAKPGVISKEELLLMPRLSASLGPEFYFQNISFTVSQYQCLIVQKGNVLPIHTINGGTITEAIKNDIKKLKKGDIVIFNNIKTVGPPSAAGPENDNIAFTIK